MSINNTMRIVPKRPLGAYPQLRLCGHVGRVPASISTKTIIIIIDVDIYWLHFYVYWAHLKPLLSNQLSYRVPTPRPHYFGLSGSAAFPADRSFLLLLIRNRSQKSSPTFLPIYSRSLVMLCRLPRSFLPETPSLALKEDACADASLQITIGSGCQ